jgi:hypothetical protein
MKWGKRLALSIALVVLGLAFFLTCRAYSRHRDLAETLAWMAQTYNPYEDGFGGHGTSKTECMVKCEDVGAELLFREALTYRGCQITTTTTSNRKDDRGLRETFNLRDIDPQSIQVPSDPSNPSIGGIAEVQFAARNNAEGLVYTGNIVGKGTGSEFMMDDVAYAHRFAKAFRHAVELCGGRASKF